MSFVFRPYSNILLSLRAMLIAYYTVMSKYKNKEKIYNDTKYRSVLEVTCAMELALNNIPFKYEPEEYILLDSGNYPGIIYEKKKIKGKPTFTKSRGTIRKISYTPDFVGDGWIIETKGFETAEFKLKWKLFQAELIKQGKIVHLFKPTNKREITETIQIIKSLNHGSTRQDSQKTNNSARKGRKRKRHSEGRQS